MNSTTPYLASIPRGSSRMVCSSRLNDGSARYCRRTATRLVVCNEKRNWSSSAPVCDQHAESYLAGARALTAEQETQPEPARTGLVAAREDADVVSWSRP